MNGAPGWCSSPRDCEDIKAWPYLLSDARSWESIRPAPFGPSRMSRINETMLAVKDSLAASLSSGQLSISGILII